MAVHLFVPLRVGHNRISLGGLGLTTQRFGYYNYFLQMSFVTIREILHEQESLLQLDDCEQ